ncbi:MAG: RNA methyltransferase [Nitrospinaceae bacterium]
MPGKPPVRRTAKKKASGPPERKPKKTRSQYIKEKEFVLYGWNACKRAFENRPQDILRMFFGKERSSQLGAEKKWCASHKLPYRQLDSGDLGKAAASSHHEGIVMVVRPVKPDSVHNLIRKPLPPKGVVVALDRVSNTHNLGGIMRICSFFGVAGVVMGIEKDQAVVTPSAARMAEGALEDVPLYQSTDLPSALRDFRAGKVFVMGADPEAGRSLFETETSFPCVVVMGNEREGISERVKKRCDVLVRIPGSGRMQSLNVTVAAGAILSELHRRRTTSEGDMA